MNNFKRIIAGIVTAGVLGVSAASGASAAGPAITPVCYFKKQVVQSGILGTSTVYNVVESQRVLVYPNRTKVCNIVQTKETKTAFGQTNRREVWRGSIEVRY